MSGKTTIVCVHGAWHGGWCWTRLAPLLRAKGHEVLHPTLTGLGDRAHLVSPTVGLDTHVADIVAKLDYGRLANVVLVGHSYAGQVIAGVASERPDQIRGLIYLDAFVPDDGECAIDLQPPDIAAHYRESVSSDGFGWLIPPRRLEVLGVEAQADLDWLRPRLVPHPFKTYTDAARVSFESLQIPSAFVECTDWMRVFAPFAERARDRGWPTREVAAGHEAMVTHPEELALVVGDLVQTARKEAE